PARVRERRYLFLRQAYRQQPRGAASRPESGRRLLEDDRLGGRGGPAADRRVAAERVWAAGRIPDSIAEGGIQAPGEPGGVARTAGGKTAFTGPHGGTGAHPAVYRSGAAKGRLLGFQRRLFGGFEPQVAGGLEEGHAGNAIHAALAVAVVDDPDLG